ncbi:uncharacterized protein LOC129771090 isoform X2 [Toxorhynchites rutilus septentrionalis]|uniref:uncharacterized protein LOC129771090 isoform X2 n=1 Tax=Toxorhynchites rutilus septentrionalis TaxID=329112 RepID=UPI00247A3192|nr:uncharacterized protein LOC129771090 isoform X2 [Toxorhynchites rutilus septentrionalis]
MDRSGPDVAGGSYCPYSTDSSSSAQSYMRPFDTVRALYETVVSLRTALEEAHRREDQLRQQISVREAIDEGKAYQGTGTSASVPHILETSVEGEEEATAREKSKAKRLKKRKVKVPVEESSERKEAPEVAPSTAPATEEKAESPRKKHSSKEGSHQRVSVLPDIQIVSHPASSHSAMASRIDVKIKVSSNINVEGSSSETETSETSKDDGGEKEQNASETPEDEEKTIAEEQEGATENVTIREEFIKGDSSGLKINLTNEENLSVVKSTEGINIRQTSSENLHVDVDRQSNPSISEGDNSVFTEDATTPVDLDKDEATGYAAPAPKKSVKKSESENQDEVDDIELIFSSDDNKEIIQEDLVSISDYEPWQEAGQSGTPVLTNFKNIPSDQDSSKKGPIERSDSDIVDGDGSPKNLFKEKSLGSQHSLGADNMKKSLDFSTKSSSLEKDSSLDYGTGEVKRDDSFDIGASYGTSALGKRWTNYNVLIETDISKCGIAEDNILEMGRRNTCPNPPAYRPIIHSSSRSPAAASNRSPLAVKFSRSPRTYSPHQYLPPGKTLRCVTAAENRSMTTEDAKRSRAAQTDITALSQQWRSETHLSESEFGSGLYTLPSKFVPPPLTGSRKYSLRIPPSYSMNSPGVSQWTVNESSIATQTTQTEAYWADRGDSFDSSKSYSLGSRNSTLSKHHRSRSVPSMRCAICRQSHQSTILRPSESMHYTPRVTFQEPSHKIRGSLPDLRHDCNCPRRYGGPSLYRIHGDSGGSTDSLLEEAEDFLRRSIEGNIMLEDAGGHCEPPLPPPPLPPPHAVATAKHRRCSENDIQRDYIPSKHALPFLPKTAKCLKPGHLAKVIARNGRVVVGRVRYIGPLAGNSGDPDEYFVGLQLPNNLGDCDGSIDGRKFFDCEPQHGIFVPFKKVVMAWNS